MSGCQYYVLKQQVEGDLSCANACGTLAEKGKGRPSIDPLVYFKLQLVMLFVVMCFGLALCDSSHFFAVRWTHKFAVKCFIHAQKL